jgi:hypothetical protein
MLPAIAKNVCVVDNGLSKLQHIRRRTLPAIKRGLLPQSSSIARPYFRWPMVNSLADGKLPEMVVEPAHDNLDDIVQDYERD